MEIKKATKVNLKVRAGIAAPSGFGKTKSALLMASGMASWDKIGVIDSENNSASLFADLGPFSTINLKAPYTPERYIEAIAMYEKAGFEVIIIDSISHEWEGKGGCLEIVDELGGGTGWKKVTPRHTKFIEAIKQSSCHIITTVRKKQEYDFVKNDKGKVEPVKVGLKEITRDGFEYELTVNFEIINDKHLARASKDRTRLFTGKPEFVITPETGKSILEWCNSGEFLPVLNKDHEHWKAVIAAVRKGERTIEQLREKFTLSGQDEATLREEASKK